MMRPEPSPWRDATLAAAAFAVDPHGLGGVLVRARPGPVRDRWLDALRGLLPAETAMPRLPLHITGERLTGGLDLAATLAARRPVSQRGLLAEADGGVILIPMAERLTPGLAADLAQALDSGQIAAERDGLSLRHAARFGAVALDEGLDDEHVPETLADRLAFHVDLSALGLRDANVPIEMTQASVIAARALLPRVGLDDDVLEALCAGSLALGIRSLRASLLAVRAARVSAALAGRPQAGAEDAALAARLVLAPRATMLPASDEQPQEEVPPPPEPPEEAPEGSEDEEAPAGADEEKLRDLVLAAALAAIPPGLLELIRKDRLRQTRGPSGRSGLAFRGVRRGRPIGARRGAPLPGLRLHVLETLRAAAPWQPIRRRERQDGGRTGAPGPARLDIRRDDFRVMRHKTRTASLAIFVVDASGSAALNRLAEAKGAVELMLAECYVRRDEVALVSFRGRGADLVLPPTRSLVRAKRSLAGLPGGGGTPLAAGLEEAFRLAGASRRKGQSPSLIVLTDGRANVARGGAAGRAAAAEDALLCARLIRGSGISALVIDTSPRPEPAAARLAEDMGARYLPMPYAGAVQLAKAARAALPRSG